MGYIEDNLMEGETIKHTAFLYIIVFLWPVIWFLVGIFYLSSESDDSNMVGTLFIIWSILHFILALINYKTSEFGTTNKRVIVKTGFIRRHSLEILLTKVESIIVDQGILGRILDYGTIVFIGTGGTRDKFHRISSPTLFRRIAQEQISHSQN